MSDEAREAKWRPRINSVWRVRDDPHGVRYTVISHEGDTVWHRRTTDGAILRRELDFWLDHMVSI